MKFRLSRILTVCFILICALAAHAQKPRKTIAVGTGEAFIKAIAPNTEIVLKPGLYTLDSKAALALKGKNFRWEPSGKAKRLVLSGLQNLVIRGEDSEAASVLSAAAPLLSFEGCSDIALSNLDFQPKGADGGSGAVLSFADCQGLDLSQLLVSGPRSIGIAMEKVSSASIRRSTFTGLGPCAADLRACEGVEFLECLFRDNAARPLMRSDSCLELSFLGCSFEGNEGGTLIDLAGDPMEVVFTACTFDGNVLDALAPEGFFPVFRDCLIDGEPFSPGTDDGEYQPPPETSWFFHRASGLAFPYPGYWSVDQEDEKVAFMDSYNGTVLFLLRADGLPEGTDPWTNPDSAFDAALAAFKTVLKAEISLDLAMAPAGASIGAGYLPAREYKGTVSGNGLTLPARMRTIGANEAIWGFITLSQSEQAIGAGSAIDQLYCAVDYAPRGE